jgi:hypothetical protein
MKKVMACMVLIAGSLAVPGQAWASSAGGHCPAPQSGHILWDVNTEPYHLDNLIDQKGNNNGTVCAKPFKVEHHDDGTLFQIYNFVDD